jgi:outer membrane protein assembly factor BamD (BamD/ComL family)
MGIFGIASSILGQIGSAATSNPNKQQIKQGFQLLGQDLQSGNLSQAKSDFASLQQLLPSGQQSSLLAPASGAQSSSPLATAVSQLAQDMKSGNVTATQSDLDTVQQDVQQLGQQQVAGSAHHHHSHHGGGESDQSSSQQNAISTLFGQLGQQLQSGNLSGAQQAYSTLQQDFQQFALNNSSTSASATSSASGANFSISA